MVCEPKPAGMTEVSIPVLNLNESKLVWNRYVTYVQYVNFNRVFIQAGNEGNYVDLGTPKQFTTDFIVCLTYATPTYVSLIIWYGTPVPQGNIHFDSNPPGSQIYLEGEYKGTTPLDVLNLAVRTYSYSIKRYGYADYNGTVTVIANTTVNVYAVLQSLANIQFDTVPQGAQVYLSGVLKGTTPILVTNLAVQTYGYTLKKSGYNDYNGTITTMAGKTVYVSVTLTTLPTRYKCVNNVCLEDPYGSYATLAECQTACGIIPERHYIDIYIKPHSWYTPNSAANWLITKIANINGVIINLFKDVIDYEYINTEILTTSDKVIMRINIKQKLSSVSIMGLPLIAVVGLIILALAIITIAVGFITGWFKGTTSVEFKKSEVAELVKDVYNEVISNCKEQYPNRTINKTEAENYLKCVIAACAGDAKSDFFNDPEYKQICDTEASRLTQVIDNLEVGNITPAEAVNEGEKTIDTVNKKDDEKIDKYKKEECCIDLPLIGCIATKKQCETLKLIGIGVGVLIGGFIIYKVIKTVKG